jgi:hypothetical protein
VLFELLYPCTLGWNTEYLLVENAKAGISFNWHATVGKTYTSLQDLIKSMLVTMPTIDPLQKVAHFILHCGEFTILSLDKYDPETMLIRVEADHQRQYFARHNATHPQGSASGSVEIVQYGLEAPSLVLWRLWVRSTRTSATQDLSWYHS